MASRSQVFLKLMHEGFPQEEGIMTNISHSEGEPKNNKTDG